MADALALAVCHLTTVPLRRAVGAALLTDGSEREGGTATVIGLLRGPVLLRTGEGEVIVDVAGVGYRVTVTPATAAALVAAGTGAEATLYVHTHVREDAIVLYGFAHDDERRCFEVLLGSHGVGPALALAIMAILSPAALVHRGARGRPRDAVHGARRGAQDGGPPADRAEEPARPARPLAGPRSAPRPGHRRCGSTARTSRAEARAALSELGYAPDEIRGALDGLRDDVGVEEMLRLALRELASR